MNTQQYLCNKSSDFVKGFLDGLYSTNLKPPFIGSRNDYLLGYAEGSQHKDELRGTAPFNIFFTVDQVRKIIREEPVVERDGSGISASDFQGSLLNKFPVEAA